MMTKKGYMYDPTETRWANEELRILAAVKLPLSEKWVLKSRFWELRPAEVPCFHNDLGVVRKTAKPLCVGSIPTRASNSFKNLQPTHSRDQMATTAGIVAGGYRFLAESSLP